MSEIAARPTIPNDPLRPTLVLHDAAVYTFDPALPKAESVALAGERIAFVGTNAEVLDYVRRHNGGTVYGVEMLGLGGAMLVPGLNDAHTHFLQYAKQLQQVDLDDAPTLDEALARVKARADSTPVGSFIGGGGWNKNNWGDGLRWPTRHDLDKVAPGHTVALASKDHHMLWLNTLALQKAGISRDTPERDGSVILREEDGAPAGVLKEDIAWEAEARLEQDSPEGIERLLRDGFVAAARTGLTAIATIDPVSAFRAAQRIKETGDGTLPLRLSHVFYNTDLDTLVAAGLRSGFGDEYLSVGGVKFFMDGALGSQTAALREPYAVGDGGIGVLTESYDSLLPRARAAAAYGLALVIHAIGDRAAAVGLDVLAAVRPLDLGLRHRMEHLQLVAPADIARLVALNITASVQPKHATSDRDMADLFWGKLRASQGYAYKSMLRAGVRLAGGSDSPVESIAPLTGIYAVISRRRPTEDRAGWYPDECLTPAEAIRAYTQGAAYVMGADERRGMIKSGMLADITALSHDFFTQPAEAILSAEVRATIVGGRVVYAK